MMGIAELWIFIGISFFLVAFTLSRAHHHRFARLIAFEGLLALILINVSYWFDDPFSWRQLLSWGFLAGSLALAMHSFWLFRLAGAAQGDIEDTSRLVTVGAYRYIRHPMYTSLILLGIGATLKHVCLISFVLLFVVMVALVITARIEERGNIEKFGKPYRDYMRHTRMFIPFIL